MAKAKKVEEAKKAVVKSKIKKAAKKLVTKVSKGAGAMKSKCK